MFPSQSPTDTEVENLINFIRGVDTYDQDGDGTIRQNLSINLQIFIILI